MARPHKNNAEYFSHDNNMRNDKKIAAVRSKFGHEGYAIWNMYLESIAEAANFRLDYGGFNPDLIAADFGTTTERLKDITDYLLSLALLQMEGSYLVCNNLTGRLSALINKRKRERSVVIADDNTQSKVKEIKGNKIPTVIEFVEYAKTLDFFKGKNFEAWEFTLKSKYQTFVDNDWKDGFNKPIKNWKNTIANVITHLQPDKSLIEKKTNNSQRSGKVLMSKDEK